MFMDSDVTAMKFTGIISLLNFITVGSFTSSGMKSLTMLRLFRTSWAATSRFVPHSSSSETTLTPSWLKDFIFLTPLMMDTACSTGSLTSFSMSWGATPEYCVMMKSVGNSISGRRSKPILEKEMPPITRTMATIMVIVTFRFTENSDRLIVSLLLQY